MKRLWKRMASGIFAALILVGSVDLTGFSVKAKDETVVPVMKDTTEEPWADALNQTPEQKNKGKSVVDLLADCPGHLHGPVKGKIVGAVGSSKTSCGRAHITVKFPFMTVHGLDKNQLAAIYAAAPGVFEGSDIESILTGGVDIVEMGHCQHKGANLPNVGSDALVYYKSHQMFDPAFQAVATTGPVDQIPDELKSLPHVDGFHADEPGVYYRWIYSLELNFVAYQKNTDPVQPAKGSKKLQSDIWKWDKFEDLPQHDNGGPSDEETLRKIMPAYLTVHKVSAHPQFDAWNTNYALNGTEFTINSSEPIHNVRIVDGKEVGEIQVKGDGNTPMTSAVNARMKTTGAPDPTHRDSISSTSKIELPVGTADVAEAAPPKGFALNGDVVNVQAAENGNYDVTFQNEPYRSPARIFLFKDDAEMFGVSEDAGKGISSREPQGDGVFSGAVFHVAVYSDANEFKTGMDPIMSFDTTSQDIEGKDYGMIDFSKDAITNFKHWKDDSFVLSDYFVDDPTAFSFPLGYVVVTEVKAPTGYTLEDPNLMFMIDHVNAKDSVTYGPQFCFTVTTEGGALMDKNMQDPNNSLDANTVNVNYVGPVEFDATTAEMNKQEAEGRADRDFVLQWTRKDENSNVIQVQSVSAVNEWEDPDFVYTPAYGIMTGDMPASVNIKSWRVYTAEFTVTDKWIETCSKNGAGAFTGTFGAGGELLSLKPYTDAEIDVMYGNDYNYYVCGETTDFSKTPVGITGVEFLGPESRLICVTMNGAAPQIGYETFPVEYRDVTFEGCYFAQDASGNKVYLTYQDQYYFAHPDEVPEQMKTWGGIPLKLKGENGKIAESLDEVVMVYDRTKEQKNLAADSAKSNAALATAPYLIQFNHEFHAYEQVIRGDVQIEKQDYEKEGPEATGASNKSNSTVDKSTDYKGTHLDKVTFAIYNLSNHYVIDPVTHKVIMPNELFCTIDTHWNEKLQTYTAETTNGRLPFGTYAIREWSQDLMSTYNLSDTQARIFEIRKNGKLRYDQTNGDQWGLTWTVNPDNWNDTAKWIKSPYDATKYDDKTEDNWASWEKAEPGKRSGAEDSYATYTKGSSIYEERIVSEGWKVNEDTTGIATDKVAANTEIRDNKEKMVFRNFPVRSDIVVKKVRDTYEGDEPVSALFILTNTTTGERHVIVTDENGEYSSAPIQSGGISFQDHDVNTNSLDSLLAQIDANKKSEDAYLKAWPDTVEIGGVYGDIPSQYFNINPDTGAYSWNMRVVGGLWFSLGENGTYTTYVREFNDNDNSASLPAYVDRVSEQLSMAGRTPRMVDIGHTELTTDASKVVGIPRRAIIQDRYYTQDPGWNIKQAGNILINNFYTTAGREGEYRLQNTDANTAESSTGHMVSFKRSGITGFTRLYLGDAGGDALAKLLADGGADHTVLNNVGAKSMPNTDRKNSNNGQAVLHIDGFHQDTRKADLTEHVFGALPYGEYMLEEVRTNETKDDHLLHYAFRVTSQGDIKDLGTIEDKLVEAKISTQAYDAATMSQVGVALKNWKGIDEVYYEGLDPKSTYTMEGSLYDLTAKEPVRYKDGSEVKVQVKFTPPKSSGTITMTFGEDRPLDMTPYRGHKIIIYEVCYDQYKEPLAEHVDDANEHQMIYFPALDSKADPMSVTDKKVEDNVFYETVKGTDGYTYANIASIIKDNGLPLTRTDMKMFEEDNILRDGNGQLIPAAEGSEIRHLFTAKQQITDDREYVLEVALWDETDDTYVYDRYNDDGTLLYDSLNGYGVFSMMGEDGRFFEAYWNPLKQEYMQFEGGTEWIPKSGTYPVVGDLAKRSVKNEDGIVYEEVITPLVSRRAVEVKTMTASELRDTVVTKFTVDTSVLSGHEITSRSLLYSTSVDLDMNLVQNHEVGGMFAPAAYQVSNVHLEFPVFFEEKEDARDGVLAVNTAYKLTAYLLDETGNTMKDRYGNVVSWQYGTKAGSSTYRAAEEGMAEIDVDFLTGRSSIGADKLFDKKLSVELVAEQGSTKKIVVGEYPVEVNRFGGTEYKKERHYYLADGTYLAAGTSVPAGSTDFKDSYGTVGAVDDTFWSFYVNPANFNNSASYESAVDARKGYVYALEDYVPVLDDLHRVTVDDRGTLTNMSYLPFLYNAKGEALLDTALVTGLTVGEDYTLQVQFYENGKLLGTEYDEFMATEKSALRKVSFYPIDASAQTGNHGPYTVKEEIRAGKIDLDHENFADLSACEAETGAGGSEKSVSWLKGLTFKEDEEGAMLTEDFGSNYKDLYLLGRKIFPQDDLDGEFPADFRLDAGVLRRADANAMTFTNILYVIDRMGNFGLADHHADLTNVKEKLQFGEDDKKFATTATVDGKKYIDKEIHVATVTDVIEYEGYDDVRKGTLRTWLILKSTGEKIPGTEKETEVEFDASGKGTFEVKIDVDLENIPNGDSMVVFEEAYDVQGTLIGQHKNPDDEGQTVYVGDEPEKKLGTTATVNNGNKSVINTTGKTTVVDVVKYEGYTGGINATLKSWLMNRVTGEIVKDTMKEQKVVLDASGTGSIVIEFEINTLGVAAGTKYVAFEELYDADGKLIGSHKDINDEGQTITITGENPDTPDTPHSGGNKPGNPGEKVEDPKTPTAGNNPPNLKTIATVGGQKTVTPGGNITITDTVSFAGYPAGEYTMAGYVVRKSTGEVLIDQNGKPISAKTKFKTDGSGSVNMTFTFNTAIFGNGEQLVVYENMLDKDGKIVGSHLDINDADQSITFKNFRKVQTMMDDSVKGLFADLFGREAE